MPSVGRQRDRVAPCGQRLLVAAQPRSTSPSCRRRAAGTPRSAGRPPASTSRRESSRAARTRRPASRVVSLHVVALGEPVRPCPWDPGDHPPLPRLERAVAGRPRRRACRSRRSAAPARAAAARVAGRLRELHGSGGDHRSSPRCPRSTRCCAPARSGPRSGRVRSARAAARRAPASRGSSPRGSAIASPRLSRIARRSSSAAARSSARVYRSHVSSIARASGPFGRAREVRHRLAGLAGLAPVVREQPRRARRDPTDVLRGARPRPRGAHGARHAAASRTRCRGSARA